LPPSSKETAVPKPFSSRLSRFTSRFARSERGATAVEFGLVSLPILVMIFGLLELALVFIVMTTLDTATQTMSRKIRTGEFQTSGASSPANFKALVCAQMTWLQAQCTTGLWVDVRTFSDFNSLAAAQPLPFAAAYPAVPTTCFSPGNPTDIVLVRAYFEWNLFTPLLNAALENMGSGSGKRLISSTTAFRNEPYSASPPIGAGC
jgi:Flp pilus assembly protein TadG